MKIEKCEKMDDCFDGSMIYGYTFGETWTRDTIMSLGSLGEVDYFADFPRPFFRVRGEGGLQVKGVEGEPSCRVIFPKTNGEALKLEFERLFEQE